MRNTDVSKQLSQKYRSRVFSLSRVFHNHKFLKEPSLNMSSNRTSPTHNRNVQSAPQKTNRNSSENKEKKIKYQVDITWSAIVKVLLTIAAIYFGFKLLQVIIILFFAFVLGSALIPAVDFLRKRGIPLGLSIVITYLLLIVTALFVGFAVVRPVYLELSTISDQFPENIQNAVGDIVQFASEIPFVDVDESDVRDMIQRTANDYFSETNFLVSGIPGAGRTLSTLSTVGGALSSLFFVIIISIYILLDHDNFLDLLLVRITDDKRRALAKELIEEVEAKLGNWMLSQGALILIIGGLTWVLLRLLGVPFSLPLALLAGLLTVIPTIGPMISVIPAAIVALFSGGAGMAIGVIVGYILIQQIDNAFITPRIMGKVSGLKPVVVVVGVMIGFGIGGVIGGLMTVPVLVLAKIGYEFFIKLQQLKAIGAA